MKSIVIMCLLHLLYPPFGLALQKADRVLAVKSESKLYLKQNGKVIRSYPVALGGNPKGHKQSQGDNPTTGCIAVTDAQMDEIWQAVDTGTPIEIRP